MKNHMIKLAFISTLLFVVATGCDKKESAEAGKDAAKHYTTLNDEATTGSSEARSSEATTRSAAADERTSVATDKRPPVMSVVGPRTHKEPVKVHVNKNDAVTIGIFSYGDNRERKLKVYRNGKPWSDPLTQRNKTVKFKLSEPGDYELYPAELTYDESKEIPMNAHAKPGVSNSYIDGSSEAAFLGYTDYHYHDAGPNRGLIVVIMDSDFDRMLPGTVANVAVKRMNQ